MPHRKAIPRDVVIRLAAEQPPVNVEVHAVAGWMLPAPVSAKNIAKTSNDWSCEFDGWQLVRFLRPQATTTDVPVTLRGKLQDDRRFATETTVRLVLKE
jgi:hypothetical protein